MSLDELPQATTTTLLATTSLATGYGGLPIVRDIDLVVGEGELVCIVGPNGSGKSTLLKALAGVLPPLEGSIHFNGASVTGLGTTELVKAGIGYVPQLRDVFTSMSVEENLAVGGYPLSRRERDARTHEMLEMFPRLGEMSRRTAGTLSGGERKMLAMARVLMLRPRLLLLDEPTAGMTEHLAGELLEKHIPRLLSNGVSVLLVEQRAAMALAAADRAYVLAAGQVAREGRAADMRNDQQVRRALLGESERAEA